MTRATPIGHPQQGLAVLDRDEDAEGRQHQRDDRDGPLQLHDQVEEPENFETCVLRHDGDAEVVALGQDRLERVEQRDAARVGLVDQLLRRA